MHTIKKLIAILVIVIAAFFAWRTYHSKPVTLSVMTFNIENGGTQIDFSKVVEAVHKANANVVGLQEAWGHTSRLAKELGWKYYDNRQHIVSRYPLLEATDSNGLYTLIEVKPGYVVVMANMHLPDDPYGPDMIKQGASAKTVEAMERKVRLPTALPYINKLSALAKDGVPVFLTGDFNSPSDLDWKNRSVAVRWPVTKTAEDNSLVDAYYKIHPDTNTATWPAGRPMAKHSFDGFNPSAKDLQDRIDFIFTGGNSKILSAEIVGEPSYKMAAITVSPWPSDHRAVVARFEVTPVVISKFNLAPEKITAQGKPVILLTRKEYKSGEPITISWRNMPGNRYDYVMIIPAGSKKTAWGEAVRLYTYGEVNGSVVYDDKTAKGNWLDWYSASEGHWPLKPAKYDVRLMLDDSNTELVKTQIEVK